MLDSRWMAADLAPGDAAATRLDRSGLLLRPIASVDDPAFAPAYQFLAGTFGHTGALERVPVLAARFAWPRQPQPDGWTLKYEMLSISDAAGRIAAVRDHSAVVLPESGGEHRSREVIVHLSHALVAPVWRRSGLGGWLRAFPLQTARDCLRLSGADTAPATITLAVEMEEASRTSDERPASLLAYEKAGFRKLDPARVAYFQPDFRPPAEIDRDGGPRPLPFSLVIRQVGREDEIDIDGAQARLLARGIYRVFRDGCRSQDLVPLLAQIEEAYPQAGERVRLVPPSAA